MRSAEQHRRDRLGSEVRRAGPLRRWSRPSGPTASGPRSGEGPVPRPPARRRSSSPSLPSPIRLCHRALRSLSRFHYGVNLDRSAVWSSTPTIPPRLAVRPRVPACPAPLPGVSCSRVRCVVRSGTVWRRSGRQVAIDRLAGDVKGTASGAARGVRADARRRLVVEVGHHRGGRLVPHRVADRRRLGRVIGGHLEEQCRLVVTQGMQQAGQVAQGGPLQDSAAGALPAVDDVAVATQRPGSAHRAVVGRRPVAGGRWPGLIRHRVPWTASSRDCSALIDPYPASSPGSGTCSS